MKRALVIAFFFVVSFAVLMASAFVAQADDTVRFGDSGPAVEQVQEQLADFGYVLKVDGKFGLRTLRVVKHFQKVSGLPVDGVVGPRTQRALGRTVVAPRTAAPPAPPAPPPPSSDDCWADLIAQNGLPASFRNIVFRESRCQPGVTSRTGCCHGLAQIHQMHIPRLGGCGIDSRDDLFDPAMNLCAAGVLYRESGMNPWAL